MQLSAPSKTFLLGEYAVLANHPCLLLSTAPRFCVLVSKQNNQHAPCQYENFSTQGPVKALQTDVNAQLQGYRFVFVDPYQGTGGFGASCAQYGLLYQAYSQLTQQNTDPLDCLKHYVKHGLSGSGAALISQFNGGITLFDPAKQQYKALSWPWQHITAVLLKTQQTVPTHVHLDTLPSQSYDALACITRSGLNALEQADDHALITAVREFNHTLIIMGLSCDNTKNLCQQLMNCPFVLATKGCGALGADVILTIVPTDTLELFRTWLQPLPLTYISDTQQLEHGLS